MATVFLNSCLPPVEIDIFEEGYKTRALKELDPRWERYWNLIAENHANGMSTWESRKSAYDAVFGKDDICEAVSGD